MADLVSVAPAEADRLERRLIPGLQLGLRIAELLEQPHPDPLRRRLLSIAARMSIIVGHMCADAGLEGHAARYLDLALDAAREAGDGDLEPAGNPALRCRIQGRNRARACEASGSASYSRTPRQSSPQRRPPSDSRADSPTRGRW